MIINQYGIKKTKQKVRAFKIRVKGKAYRKVKIARKMKGVSRGQNDEQSCLYIMMTHEIKGHTSHAEAVIPTEQLDKFEKKKPFSHCAYEHDNDGIQYPLSVHNSSAMSLWPFC